MQTTLKAGSASANITPPLGTRIPGGFRPRYAENVDDELFAKAVVIDNGTTRIAIVTCDLIAIPEKVADAAKARIADRCDIPVAHVMVNATHTHTAVAIADLLGVDEDPGYTEWVSLKIADAVELAVWRLKPARVGFASVNEERITFNRRWHMKDGTVRFNPGIENPDLVEPTGTIDPELAMMFVEADDGTPISAVANFSLHYIGTNNGNALSADYFGHFDRLMRHYLGDTCVSLLWNAASGQINNTDFSGQTKWTASGHQQAVKMANVLAGHFITEMQLMEMHETLDLSGDLATLTFQRKRITAEDLNVAEQVLSVPQGTYDAYETGPFSWVVGQPIPQALVDVYALECQRLAKLPAQMTAPIQVLRLGEAVIVALPGEVFVETGMNIKAASDASPMFLVSLANGYIGYICTDKALTQEGGYETWAAKSSLPAVGTVPAMEALVASMLD
jgi:neutral ceramidase